ncbi:MAG: hypothetical protein J7556_14990 [Acidovorax sp.]|nr:hypothetical protein [Acidovorax sp.]
MTEFNKQVVHLTKLATTQGWWQYARQRARALEADMPGMQAAVRAAVESSGYQPPAQERAQWWLS